MPAKTTDPDWVAVAGRRATVPAHVTAREMGEETIVLNLRSGAYHGLDPVGARFFAVLRDGVTLEQAADTLAREYGEAVERIRSDLWTFCGSLRDAGLIVLTDG